MNKYLYYKSKYLEYKMKRKGVFEEESDFNYNSYSINDMYTDYYQTSSANTNSSINIRQNLFTNSLDKIKKMFIYSDLAFQISETRSRQLKRLQPKSQRRSERLAEQSTNPNKKNRIVGNIIYNPSTPMLFSPNTLDSKLRSKLDDDIDAIESLQAKEEESDPEYFDYDANYGKIVETWYADTYPCPCCGAVNSLKRYSSDIFPVIDLVCINPGHNPQIHGVRYFQVKASNGYPFAGDQYFNLISTNSVNPPHIYTGSRKAGEPVHEITAESDPEDKEFLIGYICVEIKPFDPDDETITHINVKSIGYVLPRVNNTTGLYYKYIQSLTGKPKITWETSNMLVRIKTLSPRSLIPRDYLSTHFYEVSQNPLSQNLGF